MQFAVNWSPEVAALIREGLIDVDLFKCPDCNSVDRPYKTVLNGRR